MSRKAAELRELLQKCSKAELIEVIIRAQGEIIVRLPWNDYILETRLNNIEKMIDNNLAEMSRLNEKLRSIPEERRLIHDEDVRNTMIALHDNDIEYFKLQKKYDKISNELYGK